MDNMNIWDRFTITGKLEDYLEYKNVNNNSNMTNGEVSADVGDNKRNCSTRTTAK